MRSLEETVSDINKAVGEDIFSYEDLAKEKVGSRAVRAIIQSGALQDWDVESKRDAMVILTDFTSMEAITNPEVIETMLKVLQDQSSRLRSEAAELIGKIASENINLITDEAVENLVDTFKNDTNIVSIKAAKALQNIKNEDQDLIEDMNLTDEIDSTEFMDTLIEIFVEDGTISKTDAADVLDAFMDQDPDLIKKNHKERLLNLVNDQLPIGKRLKKGTHGNTYTKGGSIADRRVIPSLIKALTIDLPTQNKTQDKEIIKSLKWIFKVEKAPWAKTTLARELQNIPFEYDDLIDEDLREKILEQLN